MALLSYDKAELKADLEAVSPSAATLAKLYKVSRVAHLLSTIVGNPMPAS